MGVEELKILKQIKDKTDNIPAVGQALMADSTPVVIASNQPAVPISLPSGAATSAKQDTLLTELQLKADLTETQPTLDTNSASIKAGTDKILTVVKTIAQIQDWTAVAQNTIAKSAEYDFSAKHEGILMIQAALDTVIAHTGTEFIVQISGSSSGDEDWQEFAKWVALIGTAATDLIENNPLAASSITITLTAHALTVLGKWLLIEDATLANSELIYESASATNSITILDGTTNEHALNTAIFNVAMVQNVSLPAGVYRLRVVINNAYDVDGSSINYKVRIATVNM